MAAHLFDNWRLLNRLYLGPLPATIPVQVIMAAQLQDQIDDRILPQNTVAGDTVIEIIEETIIDIAMAIIFLRLEWSQNAPTGWTFY